MRAVRQSLSLLSCFGNFNSLVEGEVEMKGINWQEFTRAYTG